MGGQFSCNGWDSIRRMNAKNISMSKTNSYEDPTMISLNIGIERQVKDNILLQYPKKFNRYYRTGNKIFISEASDSQRESGSFSSYLTIKAIDIKLLMPDCGIFGELRGFDWMSILFLNKGNNFFS